MYTDDLATLEVLTEEAIVEQLQKRYTQNHIYTYIGDILVAVNPFTDVGIYTTKVRERTLALSFPVFNCRLFNLSYFCRVSRFTRVGVGLTIPLTSSLWLTLHIKRYCTKKSIKP